MYQGSQPASVPGATIRKASARIQIGIHPPAVFRALATSPSPPAQPTAHSFEIRRTLHLLQHRCLHLAFEPGLFFAHADYSPATGAGERVVRSGLVARGLESRSGAFRAAEREFL